MADKKSFIIHKDSLSILDEMDDIQAGKLFKAIKAFQMSEDIELDPLTKMAFIPFRNQFIRDNEKWDGESATRSEIGRIGGLKSAEARRTKTKQIEASASAFNQNQANQPVNVSVSDNVSVKENDIEKRKLKFASTLEPFLNLYGRELLNNFLRYWSEPNKSHTKFRQELEKTWDLKGRLETWASREKNFTKKTDSTKKNTDDIWNK